MNLRGGWALIQSTWATWLQHRNFFFLLAFGWMVPPLVYLFVWSTAAGGGTVGGFTRDEFVAYYLVFIVVNQLTYAQTNWTVGDKIRDGSMNTLLLRPLSPIYDTLASEVAGKVVFMTFVLPVAGVLTVLLKPDLNPSPNEVLLFIPALLLAWLLRFLWGYWLALLAFWLTRADALLTVQDSLMFLLAGQVAPVAVLPGTMQLAATVLPFRYMVGFPVEVLTGQLSTPEVLTGFAIQGVWALVTLLLFRTVWRRGVRHYSAVGG